MSSAVLTEEQRKKEEEERQKQMALDFKALLLPVQEKLHDLVVFNFHQTFEVRILDFSSNLLATVKFSNQALDISREGWGVHPGDSFMIADPKFNPEKFATRLSDFIQYNWLRKISESQRHVSDALFAMKGNLANFNP